MSNLSQQYVSDFTAARRAKVQIPGVHGAHTCSGVLLLFSFWPLVLGFSSPLGRGMFFILIGAPDKPRPANMCRPFCLSSGSSCPHFHRALVEVSSLCSAIMWGTLPTLRWLPHFQWQNEDPGSCRDKSTSTSASMVTLGKTPARYILTPTGMYILNTSETSRCRQPRLQPAVRIYCARSVYWRT